jgi:undecaprenyl-diphosphatase
MSELFRYLVNPRFTAVMQIVSMFASATAVGILCALAGGIFVYKRQWYWLFTLVLVVAGGMLLNLGLKALFDRPRPGWADPLTAVTGPGFPSGHTMMATLIYGFIAVYLILRISNWWPQALIVFGTLMLILSVAFSRMYLGAHYFSDVLGAMAAGTVWLAFCLTLVEAWRRWRISLSDERRQADN